MTERIYMPHFTVNAAAKIVGVGREFTIEESNYIAWEYTGWPAFFMTPTSFEQQILEFMRELKSTGKWPAHPLDRPSPT